jgi:hypothetical protein
MAINDLYARDFYVWTQEQAKALRARGRGDNQIDWDTLAEEVEDLGAAQRNAVMSAATRIIQHLYYLAWSRREEPRGHWESEIVNFRGDLERNLTPAIRRQWEGEIETLHVKAGEAARRAFKTHEPDTPTDLGLRWTARQILGEEADPIA